MTGLFRPLALVYSLMTQGSRKFRAFSVEQWLPPLPKSQPSSQYGHAIPVLYTNDPRSASKWIDENLSSDGSPVAVGWDVEVRLRLMIRLLCRSNVYFIFLYHLIYSHAVISKFTMAES
jgi:hypothetical protein